MNGSYSKHSAWYDVELFNAEQYKDRLFCDYKTLQNKCSYENYLLAKDNFNKLNNYKMIEYFKRKASNDFCSTKKFWEFYSSEYTLKSDKNNSNIPNYISDGVESASDPQSISEMFNIYFTTFQSNSDVSNEDSARFCENLLNKSNINNRRSTFSFHETNYSTVENLLNGLMSTSGPGISGIATKLLKSFSNKIVPILTELFNECIRTNTIPDEWKSAVVTPLFKNKGSLDDINNYRGISVLPPVAKIFEKILATQIINYLNYNKMFYHSQYGFRPFHSCEAALHMVISKMNEIRSKRLIGMFLFIDFKKAFDMVDSNLLLVKLKCYGFDSSAINLVKNYFTERSQMVKFGNHISSKQPIKLGIGQGSCLGPLFFLIFINDLPHLLSKFETLLFADDTTLSVSGEQFFTVYNSFTIGMIQLRDWCKYNKLDINWSKTKLMFVTNKHNALKEIPTKISFCGVIIEVVSNFILLGVNIDNKLNFLNHVSLLKAKVNKRLFSISKLFYLAKAVKIQFFKSFILPLFDYCLSLCIYFSKKAIQKLVNTYNFCLFKLFKIRAKIDYRDANDFNLFNNKLEVKFNLSSLQHRIIIRLMLFSHKIINNEYSPEELRIQFITNFTLNKNYNLRNLNKFYEPTLSKLNNFDEETFIYFFSRFVNDFYINNINLDFNSFKIWANNNVNIFFPKFVKLFPKFQLLYSV